MYISRIVIRNFRNFDVLDVSILPGVTCIIGENNTGKTNLLHAIRLVLDVNLPSIYRQLTENDVHCCAKLSTALQVLVSVELADYRKTPEECAFCGLWEVDNDKARVTYRFRPRQSVREAIERHERDADALNPEEYQWELTGGKSEENNDPSSVEWHQACGVAIRFQELQAFKIDVLPALRDVEADLRHSRISPLARLLTALDIRQEEKDALVAVIQTANDSVEESPTIHNAGDYISASFNDAAGEAFTMPLRLGMVSPTFTSISRNLTVLLTDGPVVDFEPSRNGLGLNNVLYVSMLLEYFRRRIDRPDTAGQLLLIEEPEAHLHPQLQRVLYSKLRQGPFQTMVTTHSTHISSASSLSSFVVLTDTGEMATGSNTLSGIEGLSAPDIADLERYLDATRSTLLFARKVLLVEGPAELFLIPPLVKCVMNVDFERHGISVVPIHGVHFAPYAKLFGPNALRKRCAILTDGDLVPSDGDPTEAVADDANDDPPVLQGDHLKEFENNYLRVFSCATTFERTLAIPGMLEVLASCSLELPAPRLHDRIAAIIETFTKSQDPAERAKAMEGLDSAVLRAAKRFGKARFAQVASKHAVKAIELPDYIRKAVEWLVADGPDA